MCMKSIQKNVVDVTGMHSRAELLMKVMYMCVYTECFTT
jgi:hypothetical protein